MVVFRWLPFLLLLPLGALAEVDRPVYRRLSTWAGSLSAASESYRAFKRRVREVDRQQGLENKVRLAEWHRLERLDEKRIVEEFHRGLLRDFPAETASFANVNGHDFGGWLEAPDPAGFARKLEARFREQRAEPYASCLRELSGERVLERFEQLVAEVNGRNRRDLPRIAFVKRRSYGLTGTNATMFSHRTDRGSSVCVADLNKPEEPVRVLLDSKDGFVWDLSASYDGSRLLMSYKERNQDPFGVWEIDADGHGLRRLTEGKYHDFNPVYYPDGRVVFCSSRVQSYSLCQDFLACALHIMNGDGSNVRRIDFTTLCSNAPAVLPDGSIACTRWEYQDKNIFSWQGLWSIHPDGKGMQLIYGNTITIPNSRYGPKPIPGTGEVFITMAAHHRPPLGDIAVVDRSRGLENPASLAQITHATSYQVSQGKTWRDTNWHPGDRFFPEGYADPMPVDDRRFLVSFAGDESLPHRIWVFERTGIGAPIVSDPKLSCFSPVPLTPRAKPPAMVGEAPQEAGEGTFYVADVCRGLVEQGVPRGAVKELRVVRVLPKKWNTEGRRYNDHYPIVGHGSYYVKENLGTVPVREDGSAWFRAPSNCELYFIALDAEGKEIQRMGSVTQVTTGEQVSCTGCHEHRNSAPPQLARHGKRWRQPDVLQPPPWGSGPFDYVRHVQPVLDRYCATNCHEGRTPAANIDLSGDKTRFFNMSYESLIQGRWVEFYFINPGPTGVFPALQSGSRVSRLTQLIESGHGGKVAMDDESRRRIYAWIDSNVQYYATWDMSRPHTVGGRDTWMFCAGNERVAPKPEPWMAGLEKVFARSGCRSCHNPICEPNELSNEYNAKINLTRPEFSRLLNAHLCKSAGGLGIGGKRSGEDAPVLWEENEARYQSLLQFIRAGRDALLARPRMDMPGGMLVPQDRDFGKVF